MQCSLDSGLIVVVFIVACLLWVVGLLLFYEFEDVCDKMKLQANDTNMVIRATMTATLSVLYIFRPSVVPLVVWLS